MSQIAYLDSRIEDILQGTFDGEPQSRIEALLIALVQSGGGGGTGVSNYNYLTNLPKIAGVELKGDKTLDQLGIITAIQDEIAKINISDKVKEQIDAALSETSENAVQNKVITLEIKNIKEDISKTAQSSKTMIEEAMKNIPTSSIGKLDIEPVSMDTVQSWFD